MEIKLPEPWERRQDETASAFDAFLLYRGMERGARSINAAYRLAKGRVGVANCRANGYWRMWAKKHEWESRATSWDAWLDREAAINNAEEIANTRLQSAGAAALIQAHIMAEIHSFPALNPKAPDYLKTISELTMEDRAGRALVLHRLASAYRTTTATRLFSLGAPRVKEDRVQSGVVQVTVQWEDEESVDWNEIGEGVSVPPVVDPAVAVDPA